VLSLLSKYGEAGILLAEAIPYANQYLATADKFKLNQLKFLAVGK
jgi:hypothetical protein